MKATSLLTALSVLCPALAWSAPIHQVWSTSGLYVNEPGASYSATTANMSCGWTQGTTQAFGNAQLTTSAGDRFEFQLVSVTAPTAATDVTGLWNISKNGTLVCSACAGHVYGFSGSFKFYGGPSGNTNGYHFSGSITNRYDY